MKKISINDYLNINNKWTRRILGMESFQMVRNVQKVENEYNLDKYFKILNCGASTMEEYKISEFANGGLNQDSNITISIGGSLLECPLHQARQLYYSYIKHYLTQYSSPRFCELGCGYGYNLSLLEGEVYGGEYSENAVQIGKNLGMDLRQFNYYNESDYDFIRKDSTVFTCHSLEQIPDASHFLRAIAKQKEKINYIVHFEPTYLKERKTLLGIFRNKYMEINDYNRNLMEVLNGDENVEILECHTDVMGLNPLNDTNIIVWKFKA